MKISASVFSNPDRPLEDLVPELEDCGVDYIHIDCKNDLSIEDAVVRIRKVSKMPIDLHLITPEPEKFYPMIKRLGIEMVTLQYEDLEGRIPDFPDLGCRFGLALMTGTALDAFDRFAKYVGFVLFMTTVPGESGGTFRHANFTRIQQFRRSYPGKLIHVDGGVNAEISFVLRNMGVFCAVSGSFLVKADSLAKAFLHLLVQKNDNNLKVRDIMYDLPDLPVLTLPSQEDPLMRETKGVNPVLNSIELGMVLEAIEEYKMGYCLFRHPDGRLAGLVTNADVRRALLRKLDDLDGIELADMLNSDPKRIGVNHTVSEMLQYVKEQDFLILNLPVVDESGVLVGAVNYNNLILGEL